MDVLYPRCAGMDVHKRTVTVTRRLRDTDGSAGTERVERRTFRTMTSDLLSMADWLSEGGVTHVAMESTGEFWKPVYNLLEGQFELLVVNAQHVKNVPGRKTDAKDSEWLSELLQHGLLRASFIPPPAQRDLRELVRHRTNFVRERVNIVNRIQKVLEGANIKLACVASDVMGVSGRAMLERMVAGEQDAAALAQLARGRLREKTEELEQALCGRVKPHQRVILGELLRQIDSLDESITRLEGEISNFCAPFEEAVRRADTCTGVSQSTAQAIISEIGCDMSRFGGSGRLSAWAGVAPGNHESAGKQLSGRCRQGNKALKRALTEAAWAASHTKGTYLAALYARLAARRGKKRAIVAVAHSILVAIYHMLTRNEDYKDLGADYFEQQNAEARVRHYTRRLERLGYDVQITLRTEPAAA